MSASFGLRIYYNKEAKRSPDLIGTRMSKNAISCPHRIGEYLPMETEERV
jgi:hypothetical protein